jgi:hypothetical protein
MSAQRASWISQHSGILLTILLTALVTNPISISLAWWMNEKSPEIVVRQYYNTVDTQAAIPTQVGELTLEYQPQQVGNKGVYLIEVSNEGRGPEERLRLQATLPGERLPDFEAIPDLRVYDPNEVTLGENGFFMDLKGFPKHAFASIAFVPPRDAKLLCGIKIKAAGKQVEGTVEAIEGVACE